MEQRIKGIISQRTSSGPNTSDATATPTDLLLGKVAYNNEGRFEGTIETYDGANTGGVDLITKQTIEKITNQLILKTGISEEVDVEQIPIDIAYIQSQITEYPTYVETEASRVASVVANLQNENTISFIAFSDAHLNSNDTQSVASNTHCYQGATLISQKVPINFSVHLGDLVAGTKNDTFEIHTNDLINSLRLSSTIELKRLCGNHDANSYNPDIFKNSAELYRYIGRFNKDIVRPSEWVKHNYFYFDLEEKKVRFICLNTGDGYDAPLADGGGITSYQLVWLADLLEQTGTMDDWKFIVMSHHPIHWAGRLPLVLQMLDDYNLGKSGTFEVDEETVSYDFVTNNKARLICTINGHIHNFNYGVAGESHITRVTTPNACFGRNNEYGHTKYGYSLTFARKFGDVEVDEYGNTVTTIDANGKVQSVPIVYPKKANSATDTSFIVYTIDLAKEIIYATCYGAGTDREISFKKVPYYTITNNLTMVSNNNVMSEIAEGKPYKAILTIADSEKFGEVQITMGGVDITSMAYANGVINIENVTGNIIINASIKTEEPIVNIIDLVGAVQGARIKTSTGAHEATPSNTNLCATNLIDLKPYDTRPNSPIVIRSKGVKSSTTINSNIAYCLFDANGNRLANGGGYFKDGFTERSNEFGMTINVDENYHPTITLDYPNDTANTVYGIKIGGFGNIEDWIITINQEIPEGE